MSLISPEDAFAHGQADYLDGVAGSQCPYDDDLLGVMWMRGWDFAFSKHKNLFAESEQATVSATALSVPLTTGYYWVHLLSSRYVTVGRFDDMEVDRPWQIVGCGERLPVKDVIVVERLPERHDT